MNYDAVAISMIDLAGGMDFFKELDQKSSFGWLSANIVNKETKLPIFTPYIIKEKAGLRIGIAGLTGSDQFAGKPEDGDFVVLPWQSILPQIIEEMKSQCDMIILLSSFPSVENKRMSAEVSGVHILIESGSNPRNNSPELSNNTLLCRTGKNGKYLGLLRINWNESGQWENTSNDPMLAKKQEHDRLEWQLKRLRSKGDPELIYRDKPANLRAYRKLMARQDELEKEMLSQQTCEDESNQATFNNSFLELGPKVANDPEIAAIVMTTKQEVNAIGKKKSDKIMLPGYAGSRACMQCHNEIYLKWAQSQHGRAYETLARKKQQFNTNCLPCHVTGISMQEAGKSLFLAEKLHNVGCESCHNAGAKHVSDPQQWQLHKTPAATVCLQCHTPEHDDNFNYAEDSIRVH